MFKVGIIGATGYVGVELLRLLLNHDKVTVTAISSSTFKDEEISSVYKSFFNKTTLVCEDKSDVIDKCDVIFTALPHGLSEEIAVKAISKNKKVIDIKQSVIYDNEIGQGFITMTVLYENTKKIDNDYKLL